MPLELSNLEQNTIYNLGVLMYNHRDVLSGAALEALREEVTAVATSLAGEVPLSKEKSPQYRRVRRLVKAGFVVTGSPQLSERWYHLVNPDGLEVVVDLAGRVFTYTP